MARMNEILVGRFNRGMQKLFGIKGPPPVAQLATEIGVQHALFNGAENRYLEGWNRFAVSFDVGAVGAQNSSAQIFNPLGSNVIAVIEKLSLQEGTLNDRIRVALITTNIGNLGTLITSNRLDARIGGSGSTLTVSETNNAGVTGGQIWIANNPSANFYFELIPFEDQEITLLPGDAIRITSGLNATLVGQFVWRERVLEDSEKT